MSATSASERVYTHVKQRVLDGGYPAGELLTEGAVAAEVGVSRTPVREAMLRLEVEGFLRLYPKKGALVVPVSVQEADDVLQARALIETWAAPRAHAAGAELADVLDGWLAEMITQRAASDPAAFSEADRSFHEALVSAAGNSILARLYRSLRERQVCINTAVMRVSAERMDVAVDEHTRLVALLRGGDREAFVALTDEHLARAAETARGAVR